MTARTGFWPANIALLLSSRKKSNLLPHNGCQIPVPGFDHVKTVYLDLQAVSIRQHHEVFGGQHKDVRSRIRQEVCHQIVSAKNKVVCYYGTKLPYKARLVIFETADFRFGLYIRPRSLPDIERQQMPAHIAEHPQGQHEDEYGH